MTQYWQCPSCGVVARIPDGVPKIQCSCGLVQGNGYESTTDEQPDPPFVADRLAICRECDDFAILAEICEHPDAECCSKFRKSLRQQNGTCPGEKWSKLTPQKKLDTH